MVRRLPGGVVVAGKRPGWRQRQGSSVLIAVGRLPALWVGLRRGAATGCLAASAGRWTLVSGGAVKTEVSHLIVGGWMGLPAAGY